MNRLDGKVAVVTGASKGIGAGIASQLAGAGAAVVVNYANDRQGAERIVDGIVANGGKALAAKADVSKSDDVERMFDEATGVFGKINVLVNNAGVFEFGPVEKIERDRFDRLYQTNVWGPIQTIQTALERFDEKGGSIINIGSAVTRVMQPGAALYAGTKGALEMISIVLSKELGPRQIRVNVISPGATETEGAHAVGAMTDEARKHYSAGTPLGRIGQPEDIARLAVFLASDESSWITGEVIYASGGMR